jgi:ankyrin repeat protein
VCQFDSLSKCLSSSDIRKALSSLPRTLDETYERILVNIPIEFQSKAINALKWIIYGKSDFCFVFYFRFSSGFTLAMLADAIAINHEADPPFNLGDRLLDPSQLLEILPGLITTEGRRNSVQIAHFSIVEYLESARIVDGPANIFHFERSKAINSIIKDCFDLLKSYAHPINQQLLGDDARKIFPLEVHAWRKWYLYVESLSTPIDLEISRSVVDFVMNMKAIQERHHYTLPPTSWSIAFIESAGKPLENGLYTACDYRAPNIARMCLDAGADVNFQGSKGSPFSKAGIEGTALQIAADRGYSEIVRLLLDAGADVNSQGGESGTALHIAAVHGYLEIVKILLDAGADVNLSCRLYGTVLGTAATYNKIEIVRLLLDAGADINSQAGERGTALHIAATTGHLEIVKLLLDRGANTNLTGKYGTALQGAAEGNEAEIVRVLLDAGADVNLKAGYRGTALQIAATKGHLEMVKLLLDAGADLNLSCGIYGTALQAAATQDTTEIIRALLDAGADVNSQAGEWGTALYIATAEGLPEIVKLLLDRGADVNLSGGKYGTALQAAQEYKDEQVVDMLLKAGAK